MKIKYLRRVMCVLLAVIMILPAVSAVPLETKAASTIVDISIDNVKRKYRECASFLKLCNDYRATKNLTAWDMDTELFDLAMKKAAELSVYTDENNLDGSNFLDNNKQNRGMLIGYAVSNNAALLESFKTEPVYSSNLTSTTFNAAGVGVVEVNKLKYIVVFLAKKDVTPVDDSVLTQSNTTVSEPTRCRADYLTECTLNFKDNDQIVCGGNVAMRFVVHNQKFDEAYAYISSSNSTITSSNTSIFKVNGDGTIVGLSPGTATITMTLNSASAIKASAKLVAVAKSFAGCTISKIPDQYYSGSAITPTLTITSSEGVGLVIGKDYTLSYVNNIEVGTAVVKITGMGAYAGATGSQNFNIVSDPNSFSVTLKSSEPAIEVGQTTNLIATPANASTPVKYKFEAAPQGSSTFSVVRAESTDATCTYKPATAGTYNLRVTAVDAKNRVATSNLSIEVSTPIVITIGLSSSSLTLGNNVTITAKATGGSSPYKFAYYILEPGKSSYTALASFGSLQTLTYKPTSEGTHTVKVDVKGSNEVVATSTKSFNVGSSTPVSPLSNNSSINASSVAVGSKVSITGSASGGTSPYKYAFYYKLSSASTWTKIGTEFGTATSAEFTASAAGTYNVKVTVKDNKSATADKTFNVTSSSTLANNSTLSASKTNVGVAVTLTGNASGGTSPYKYAFYYKLSGESSWTKIGTEFGSATTASFKPSAVGTYDLKVTVKDNVSMTKDKTFTLTSENTLANNSTLSASKTNVGTAVTLTGAASGGASSYKYAFYYKLSSASDWTKIGTEFGTATTATFKPTVVGTYSLKVIVKDGASMTKDKTFTLTSENTLANNSTLSASKTNVGTAVTLTGAASGGASSYKYAFYYKLSSASDWTKIGTEFGTATTAAFKPTAVGTYNLKVTVKDGASMTKDKTFTLTAVNTLANNSTLSSTKTNVGTAVTLTGAASGGTSPYKYAFYYKLSTASTWTTIGTAFGTATTASFKPTAAGTYNLKVTAKDNASVTADKTFTLTAVVSLANNSKLSSTKTDVGTAVTLTGAASGGTSPYKYAFYYKLSAASTWTTIGTAFGTATTASFKPTAAGTYNLKVTAKDSASVTADKTFTLTVAAALVNNYNISTSKIAVNNTVSITGSASGGTGSYTYAFYYKLKDAASYTVIGTEFSSTKSASFKPNVKGDYLVKISVKDSTGTIKSKAIALSVNDLVNKSALENAKVGLGTAFTVKGNASGGTAPYTYAFYYKKESDSAYTTIGTEYGTNKSAAFKAAEKGVYKVRVCAKDKNGYVSTLVLTGTVTDLANKSTADFTKVGIKNTVNFTGNASGGTAPYKYAFYYKRSTNTVWNAIGTEFGSSTTAKLTPTAAATYNVRIVVKDSTGAVSNKAFTITSTDLANNSAVSATAMRVNSKLTITGKASGGSKKGYNYTYYYKRSTNTNWNTIGTANTTETTASVKPTAAAVYDVKVVAKDSAGTAAVKTFKVKVTNLTNNSTISSTSLKSTATLTLNGKAANGLTPYKYAYYYKRTENTNWKTIGDEFGTSATASFKPGAAGTFDIKIVVKDASGLKSEKLFKCVFS